MPVVSASATPCTMNSTPINVARPRTVQSTLKITKPATTRTAPSSNATHQSRATARAAAPVSLVPNGIVRGTSNMAGLRSLAFPFQPRRRPPPT
jgi:hypothetical protein